MEAEYLPYPNANRNDGSEASLASASGEERDEFLMSDPEDDLLILRMTSLILRMICSILKMTCSILRKTWLSLRINCRLRSIKIFRARLPIVSEHSEAIPFTVDTL